MLVSLLGTACGSGINDALFYAFQSGSRTLLDVLIADLYSDLPNFFTLPPASGEPGLDGDDGVGEDGGGDDDGGDDGGGDDGGGGGGDDDGGNDGDLVGDAVTGEALYGTNGCSLCHCADAVGDCLPGSPNLQGSSVATNREFLLGDTPHLGGKSPELTEQDLADLVAFLADVGGGGMPDDGGDQDDGGMASGDAGAGEAFFTANSCSACHCPDGSGGCAASAPRVVDVGPDTVMATLAGDAPHLGGKIDDITDQQIADLVAFLTQ